MTLEASGTLKNIVKIQYLLTLVRGNALHYFDTLSAEIRSARPETLPSINLGLGTYFFPVNALSKQKRAIYHGKRKPRGLIVRS